MSMARAMSVPRQQSILAKFVGLNIDRQISCHVTTINI